MSIINIDGKNYELINGTQSDGRCFFASIFYDLNNRVAENNELNEWIEENVIEPILNKNIYDCPTFFTWAYFWAEEQNHIIEQNETTFINHKINYSIKESNLIVIYTTLERIQDYIQNFKNQNNYSQDNMNALLEKITSSLEFIETNYINFLKELDASNMYNNISNYFVNYITNFDKLDPFSIPIDKNFEEFIQHLNTSITTLIYFICNQTKDDEYNEEIRESYKSYITSLNKPINGTYEWANPNVGILNILFNNTKIKSINIYREHDSLWVREINPIQSPLGEDLFVYYVSMSHYKPLIPIKKGKKLTQSKKPLSSSSKIDLKSEAEDLKTELKSEAKDLKSEAEDLKSELKSEAKDLKSEVEDLKTEDKETPLETHITKETNTNKKDKKTPNSLIIFVKTRIPNYFKMNYEPKMTVQKIKSHTVYFDPLIKYYEGPITNIPSKAPKDLLYTQFFESTEFDTMINRILSDFRYMQKERTFEQAFEQNIINNNIDITLHTLFKPNNLFYINGKPYSIVGSKFNSSDWQIDRKPLEKLLNQFSHLSVKQIEENAKNEETDIPESLRQGNLSSSELTNEEKMSSVSDELQKAIDAKTTKNMDDEILGMSDSFINIDKLPGVSQEIKDLYSKYLKQNIPINYSDISDLSRDPLTMSLLINPEDLLSFINANKKTNIINLYSAFIDSKVNLENADKNYNNECASIAKHKTNFDKEIDEILDTINHIDISSSSNIKKRNDLIKQFFNLKIDYMTIIFKIADAIDQIYTNQNSYFVSLRELLKGLKEDYVNIIKYYEEPTLALKCIENDIVTVSSLIELDPENQYSVSYYNNYNNFKEFYENKLYKNQEDLLNPKINYSDELDILKYNPNILLLEKDQYELYYFKMLMFHSYNQFDIWVLLFKSIEIFVKNMGTITSIIINNANYVFNNLNDKFSTDEQNEILDSLKITGIRANLATNKTDTNKTDTNKKIKWYLVKSDGKKPDKENLEQAMFEPLYIEYVKSNVKSYDAIILYVYLLEILCLRQNRVYVAEENVNQLNLEFSLTLNEYYNTIIENDITDFFPKSLLFSFDIKELKNIEFVKQNKQQNDKLNIIYKGRIKSIEETRNYLIKSCDKISQIITPNVSKKGFIEQCKNIITTELTDIIPHVFRSSYWINKTINNYDIQSTNDFIYNMNRVVKDAWYDRIIDDISSKDYLDWIVYNNDSTNISDSLYSAISDGLNRQLELDNNETTNPFTELIDDKHQFTLSSLKRMVKELFDNNIYHFETSNTLSNTLIVLQKTLKIKFIIFTMFPVLINDIEDISIGNLIIYKDKPTRVISINKNYDGSTTYNLYNGYDEFTNIKPDELELYKNNVLNDFNIYCDYTNNSNDYLEYNDYLYLVLSQSYNDKTNKLFFKYHLVQNTENPYIFQAEQIPIYIKYFIFNSCDKIVTDNTIIPKMGLNEIQDDLLQFIEDRQIRINKAKTERNSIEIIKNDIQDTTNLIEKYNDELTKFEGKEREELSLEEQAEELLLEEEIQDLQEKITQLELVLKQQTEVNREKGYSGGARTLLPRYEYAYNYDVGPQYNQYDYPLKYSVIPNNMMYLPGQVNRYSSTQQNIPYNVSQNKIKDQKSFLAFYITVELELFPGKSANTFQKSVVKCQSNFERIREAWADIFGYQYRPAPMNDALEYMYQPSTNNKTNAKTNAKTKLSTNKSSSTIKRRPVNKNKTRKNVKDEDEDEDEDEDKDNKKR